MATRRLLSPLARTYERERGQGIDVESVGGVDALRRVRAGAPFDFVVLASPAIDELAAGGHVDERGRIDFARSPMALAVRAGTPLPDVSSEAALRDVVQRAATIGCSTGPSGAHLARLLERWGIATDVAPRLVQAPPGVAVGSLVARGDAALGFQQLSELLDVPGIQVSSLPPQAQVATLFSAAVCRTARAPEAALALLAFLASPRADDEKRRHGMEPARAVG
jgi:molybdate transport system substrate-binding protein